MTKIEQELIDIANKGQTDKKVFKGEGFTRSFAGRVKDVAELRNPLTIGLLVYEIDKILEIINPALIPEIDWLGKLKSAIKIFHNDIIISNRLLGIKNDNEYDMRVFEKVVMEKFMFQLKEKPTPNTLIQTDFKTMVEMVELGVRRFGR
jgi:hypothetical protein